MVRFTKRKRSIYPSAHRTTRLKTIVFVTFAGLVSLLVSYQMAPTLPTGKSDTMKVNSNTEANIKNRTEAVVGEVEDAADEKAEEEANAAATEKTKQMTTEGAQSKVNNTTVATTEEEGAKLKVKEESGVDDTIKTVSYQMAPTLPTGKSDTMKVNSNTEANIKNRTEAVVGEVEDAADEKAEEEANAAATEKTKQMTTEGAQSKVNDTTVATTEEEGAKLKVKEESGVDDTMKTCEVRDLSSYNVGTQYTKKLKTSMTDTNCLSFKCIHNRTEDCDNGLPTNYDGPDPPCCTHILRDMARTFDNTMCILGLDYMASFGTLLGFVRSDRIIPWTADNDYIISESTANAMVDLWDAHTTGLAYMWQGIPRMCVTDTFAKGKLLKWKIAPGDGTLWSSGFPYIDLYPGKNYTNDRFSELQNCNHKYSDIWPTQRVQVYNKTFSQNVPANPEQVLRRVYGKNWRIPDKGKKEHGVGTCKPLVP